MVYRALVGFSGKIASGKSSTARAVMKNIFDGEQYKVISFADALRDELNEIITGIREAKNDDEILALPIFEDINTDKVEHIVATLSRVINKDSELDSRSRTPEVRHAMQYWGTTVRRSKDDNYWVNRLHDKVRELHFSGFHVCVDDVRFNNEATSLILNDGILVRIDIDEELQRKRLINRDGTDKVLSTGSKHSSETEIDDFPWFHLVYTSNDNEKLSDVAEIISDELALQLAKQKTEYENTLLTLDSYEF